MPDYKNLARTVLATTTLFTPTDSAHRLRTADRESDFEGAATYRLYEVQPTDGSFAFSDPVVAEEYAHRLAVAAHQLRLEMAEADADCYAGCDGIGFEVVAHLFDQNETQVAEAIVSHARSFSGEMVTDTPIAELKEVL